METFLYSESKIHSNLINGQRYISLDHIVSESIKFNPYPANMENTASS